MWSSLRAFIDWIAGEPPRPPDQKGTREHGAHRDRAGDAEVDSAIARKEKAKDMGKPVDETEEYPLPNFFDLVRAKLSKKDCDEDRSWRILSPAQYRTMCLDAFSENQKWIEPLVPRTKAFEYIQKHMNDRDEPSGKACLHAWAFMLTIRFLDLHITARQLYSSQADRFVKAIFPPSEFKEFLRTRMSPVLDTRHLTVSVHDLERKLRQHRLETEYDREKSPENQQRLREERDKQAALQRRQDEERRKKAEELRQQELLRQQQEEQRQREDRAREEKRRRDCQERIRQAQQQWAYFDTIAFCKSNAHIYPTFIKRECPFCRRSSEQEEIEATTCLTLDAYLAEVPKYSKPFANFLVKPPSSNKPNVDIFIEIDKLLTNHPYDTVGIGNLLLEGLLVPNQQYSSAPGLRFFFKRISAYIAARFRIPPLLGYAQPLRDEQLPVQLRRSWSEYEFPQLMIFAYLLGATWKTLPAPHDKLLPYYELMAERQKAILTQVSENFEGNAAAKAEAERLARMEAEIAALRQQGTRDNIDPALIEVEVEHIKQQYLGHRK